MQSYENKSAFRGFHFKGIGLSRVRCISRKAERVRCSGRGRMAGSGPSFRNCKLAGRNLCLAQNLDPISAILLLKGVKEPGPQSPEL